MSSLLKPFTLVFYLACFSSVSAESPVRPGDRVAIVGNTYADQLRIHGYLETLLLQRSGDEPVSVRNLGWGGDLVHLRDRPTNFPSEASTLTSHKTDVILICFGMGESFAGKSGLSDFWSHVKRFIAYHKGKKYNGESLLCPACLAQTEGLRENPSAGLDPPESAWRNQRVFGQGPSPGILVRIPPKEYAFLEINPDLDAQGYEVLDPRRVHASFAKEKPRLEQRAVHLTALEREPTP